MRTSNPALNENAFSATRSVNSTEQMTVSGTVNKTLVLLALLLMSAAWMWGKFVQPAGPFENPNATLGAQTAMPFMIGGMILGFVVALVTIFKKEWSAITAPVYAVCEGLVLGGISAMFEMKYPGIAIQSVALTFGTLFALLFAYQSGMIKASDSFKRGIIAATGAIALVYLASIILSFFKIQIPLIFGSGMVGIVFSLVVVVIAALNLVLDFDLIEKGAEQGAPKYMEWYGAFALLVTLVWLYMEILRLLAKLRDRK